VQHLEPFGVDQVLSAVVWVRNTRRFFFFALSSCFCVCCQWPVDVDLLFLLQSLFLVFASKRKLMQLLSCFLDCPGAKPPNHRKERLEDINCAGNVREEIRRLSRWVCRELCYDAAMERKRQQEEYDVEWTIWWSKVVWTERQYLLAKQLEQAAAG
jgi:hypothetical protein